MPEVSIDRVMEVRGFNRLYTDVLGLLEGNVYQTKYTLPQARVLYELSKGEHTIASDLCRTIHVDAGYMSRIIASFEKEGLVERRAGVDSREREIRLTEKGREAFHTLEASSNDQVTSLLSRLDEEGQKELSSSIASLKRLILKATSELTVRGYAKGDERYIIDRHISMYESERGFNAPGWKSYVGESVREMMDHYDAKKDAVFILENRGVRSGCVAIKHDSDETAQFRYYFIEPELRGIGAGKLLMEKALSTAKEMGYKHLFLWTVSDFDTARHIYSRYGFVPTDKFEDDSWGVKVTEERWDLDLD